MKKRILRVNRLIKEELGKIILREVDLPKDILATITRVESSPNLEEAKVFVSTFPETKSSKVLKILNAQIYQLQQKLNKKLKMYPVPKIRIVEEKKVAEAGRIEKILEELKKNKNTLR